MGDCARAGAPCPVTRSLMPVNLPAVAQHDEAPIVVPGRLPSTREDVVLIPLIAEGSTVFRLKNKAATPQTETPVDKGPGAKGRPTPTRKEAEAAARERARAPMDKKAAQKVLREGRASQNAQIRQGMRTGDERYLPARDKGPVKKFIRTYVDSRLTVVEFLLPILVVIMVMQYSHQTQLVRFSAVLMTTMILVVALDTVWLVFRVKRALRAELPDEHARGITPYTLMRAMQIRPLRQPKPQVRVGGQPR